MSWAKKRKRFTVAEGERTPFDISMMMLIKCASCGCHIKYTIKKSEKKQYCDECEKVRKKHNIPW